MSKQSNDIYRLRDQIEPGSAFSRGRLSGYKRQELERMLEEQADTIAGMKQVFYRESEELRDQLMVLNAENRSLRERIASLEHERPSAVPPAPDELALRERLRPIVEKLQVKHQQELSVLRGQLRDALSQLEQATTALADARAKSGSQVSKRQAAEAELVKALQQVDGLQQKVRANEEAARLRLEELEKPDDAPPQARHAQEYKQALSAALRQAARQEETIQTLTRQLEAAASHHREQRTQQMEYLRDIHQSFELFFEFMSAGDQPSAKRDNLMALFQERKLP